jgi:hypothetical protein
MRGLTGKSARLSGVDFDKNAVNVIHDEEAEAEEAKIHEQAEVEHNSEEAKKAREEAKLEAKVQAALASHEPQTEAEKLEEQPKLKPSSVHPAENPNKETK